MSEPILCRLRRATLEVDSATVRVALLRNTESGLEMQVPYLSIEDQRDAHRMLGRGWVIERVADNAPEAEG